MDGMTAGEELVNPMIAAWEERASMPFAPVSSDFIIGVLLGCFLIVTFALADRSHYLPQLIRNHFPGHSQVVEDEIYTSRSFWVRLLLFVLAFLSVGLCAVYLLYWKGIVPDNASAMKWMMLSAAAVAVYLVLKYILYVIVNIFLFTRSQTNVWNRTYADIFLFFGIGCFLLAVCGIFFEMSMILFSVCLVVLILMDETVLAFKAFHHFFEKKYGGLHLFVYLCALEWIPLLIGGKIFIQFCSTV